MKLRKLSTFLLVVFFILGCKEEVDDQTIAKGESWAAANPQPIARDFVANNRRHKILVAVIDSGIDYNHPSMLGNIHFTLNEKNQPVGVGYDFTGEDSWPSPYVARTRDINPDADPKEIASSRIARNQSARIIKIQPRLGDVLNPLRNIEQEQESAAHHGTHVSGLASYDEPRIGLLSYRVLPVNIKWKNGEKETNQDATSQVLANILKSMNLAVTAGARVINMSLALKSSGSISALSAFLDEKQIYKTWMQRLGDFMQKNPDVVFVAAAGNESKWVDDQVNLQIPCGIPARNLICVGALDSQGKLASFSNLVLSPSTFVAVEGIDVLSTVPTAMCDSPFFYDLKNDNSKPPFNDPKALNDTIKNLSAECLGQSPLKKSSGTSMASPIVARMAAQILIREPEFSAEEVISSIVAQSNKVQLGPLLLNRLKFEKPTWYK